MPGDCQCASGRVDLSARSIVAHTGERAVVPEGPPMALSSVGVKTGDRSSLSSTIRLNDCDGKRLGAEGVVSEVVRTVI
jgi:hypothetical protein